MHRSASPIDTRICRRRNTVSVDRRVDGGVARANVALQRGTGVVSDGATHA